ncbi:MAG TPA: S9 family peptidase [Crocinitomix sp.]|nr:S9 family peptidase [Crocinitomix sp.]
MIKNTLLTLFIGLTVVPAIAQKKLTLEDAVMNQYNAYYPERSTMVKWIPNTANYAFLSADYQTLFKANVKNNKKIELINTSKLSELTGKTVRWVNVLEWKDENAFYTLIENTYFLIDVSHKSAKKIAEVPENAENDVLHSKINAVAYTIDNNLFLTTKNETIQITNFDKQIVSGQAIARSEFGISGGIFWSPEGNYLAFYQKDESEVADYPLLNINTIPGTLKSIKYPMAGQKSEKSRVGIYNLKTHKTVYISPKGASDDYLTNLAWGPKEKYLYIAEVNRDQDHTKLQKYDINGTFIKTLFEEKSDKWTEPEHPVYFVNDQQFIWFNELKTGFSNLYLYNTDGKLVKQLTDHNWVVQDIIGYDDKGNVYYKGTGESPLETHYFMVNINSGFQCNLTEIAGTHKAIFSTDYKYMFDIYSNYETPNQEIIYDIVKRKKIRTVLTAENPYKNVTIGTAEYGTIKSADKKTDLYYRLIKPSNFDPTKKYPVLVYVYGGPHAQLVKNAWLGGASLWMYWLAEQGYLVYTVDNRGSANRGFEFESVIHRHLGDNEMADQMEGVKFLKSLPYVDADRLAVHGWSFGGFMTTSLMLRYPGVFTTGVAGGPVTDWKYYEIMYGERYMDRPKQNEEGYKKARLMEYVNHLEGDLLLIHGTVDDVVVMQHNLALVKAFVDNGVQVDFFPYPMHKHNVRGKDRVHLMTKVLNYVIEHNK